MVPWTKLYEQRDWVALENWWRHCDDLEELRAFFRRLNSDVPTVLRRNGMEEKREHVRPDEASVEWSGGAKILLLGELLAAIEGEPRPMPEVWREERQDIVALLKAYLVKEEVTAGDPTLSQAAHARIALDLLEQTEWCTGLMADEIDPDRTKRLDRDWLIAFAEEIVSIAFHAGAHARAAEGKIIEKFAVSGKKSIDGSKKGNESRVANNALEDDLAMQRMCEIIKSVQSISNAARKVGKETGRNPGSLRRMWYRRYHKNS